MTTLAIKNKIVTLEAEIKLLKNALGIQPDFAIDEVNWKKVKPIAMRARRKLAQKLYA